VGNGKNKKWRKQICNEILYADISKNCFLTFVLCRRSPLTPDSENCSYFVCVSDMLDVYLYPDSSPWVAHDPDPSGDPEHEQDQDLNQDPLHGE